MTVFRLAFKRPSLSRARLGFATLLAFAFALLAGAGQAHAELLLNLSTGTGLSNLQVDPQWTVSSSFFQDAWIGTKVLDAPGFPFDGPWLPNSSDSKWITPNDPAFTQQNAPPASSPDLSFAYRTTFWLDPGQVATTSIAGLNGLDPRWTSDNNGLSILLNGAVVSALDTGSDAFRTWHSFAPILGGFQSGQNTLDFVVQNLALASGNPTGLRVEAELFAAPVPEPSSVAMALVGGGLAFVLVRRRNRRSLVAHS